MDLPMVDPTDSVSDPMRSEAEPEPAAATGVDGGGLAGILERIEQRMAALETRFGDAEHLAAARVEQLVERIAAILPQPHTALLGEIRGTVARIEQDAGQRYDALQANASAFADQIRRVEAGQGQRLDGVDAVLQRLEALAGAGRDTLARIEADAGRRFEALMAEPANLPGVLGRQNRSGGGVVATRDQAIALDFRAETRALDTALAALAEQASEEIVALNGESELDGLARRSPSLRGNDWSGYIRLSELRFVRAAALLERRTGKGGRVLEFGSYFGGLSLMLARAGWQVTAVDSYAEYSPALDRHVALMREEGVEVVDFDRIGYDLEGLPPASFDAVCCMSVIEHVPHTPRLLLEAIDRVLKPGGTLVLDTPNLAYEYKRWDLAAGRTVFAPLVEQYETDIPFAGHHREYTPGEVRWMMERIGYEDIALDTFSYSIYGMTRLYGEHLARFEAMAADPDRRELIIAAARKPAGAG
jgi:SAM-dependent methyltransferase